MTLKEQYDLKRNNFISQTLINFCYLLTDYNFDGPEIKHGKQSNGLIITDKIIYKNIVKDRIIEISNSYHPNDYGFELNVYYQQSEWKHSERKMLYYWLQEKQDVEQKFINQISKDLKKDYDLVLKGEKWFD